MNISFRSKVIATDIRVGDIIKWGGRTHLVLLRELGIIYKTQKMFDYTHFDLDHNAISTNCLFFTEHALACEHVARSNR
jgi:hypothetical protein